MTDKSLGIHAAATRVRSPRENLLPFQLLRLIMLLGQGDHQSAEVNVFLAGERGYSEAELRKMTRWVDDRQETIIALGQNGKIRSIGMLDDTPDERNEK